MVIGEKGLYSVKSAYRFLKSEDTLSSANVNTGVWKKIWTLQIPPKVRNLVWHACANCLPTKFALRTK